MLFVRFFFVICAIDQQLGIHVVLSSIASHMSPLGFTSLFSNMLISSCSPFATYHYELLLAKYHHRKQFSYVQWICTVERWSTRILIYKGMRHMFILQDRADLW
jgi:hypothetical protein